MKLQKEKIIIVLTVLIDVVGLGIIIPVLPFYVEKFGASPMLVTLLFSVFAFFSFVSGPFLGALSDRIGRRPVLILSIASTAIGWFVFASAHVLWVLFLGRIIDGMAAGNFPIAQSYLVDIARDEKERTSNLGIIGAVWGVGFILGPAIGAFLSSYSAVFPFWFVGGLATLNVIGALFFLPETHKQREVTTKKLEVNPLKPLIRAIKDLNLRSRYLAWFLFGIAFSSLQSIFALFSSEVFGFNAPTIGTIYTSLGVVMVINQVYALKNIWLKYFSEDKLEIWFFLSMALGFLLVDIKNIFLYGFGLAAVFISQSALRAVLSSSVTGVAGPMRRGEVLGIMSSILSVSMIVGPLIAGVLFQIDFRFPFLVNVAVLLVAFFIMKATTGKQEKIEEIVECDVLG